MVKLTWARAAAWRARRHFLDGRAPAGSLLPVVSRLCGLHAQVMSSAELTLWARVEGLERGAVQRALWQDRTLVKTWAMRGTLHLLPAAEFDAWIAALSLRPRYLRPVAWQKYFGLTLEDLDRLTEAIGTALEGRVMNREDLSAEVARVTGSSAVKLSSWGTILKPAAFTGQLCFAPSSGQRVRFTHPRTWLSRCPDGAAMEPMPGILRRYLAAYGPATHRDLARWWGAGGVVTARRWIEALCGDLTPVEIEGTRAWVLSEHARELCDSPPLRSVRLLPGFDQYVVAATCHADHLLPGDFRSCVYRPQGWISPVLLVNGMMRGTWRHEIKGSRVQVTVEPFVEQPVWVRREATRDAERLADFLGYPLQMLWRNA